VPFTIGESRSPICSGVKCSWRTRCHGRATRHTLRFGASIIRHETGGTGSEPGTAILGTFTFLNATTAPFTALTLNDVQQYTQPISYGISSYNLKQWMSVVYAQDNFRVSDDLTLDLGLRYDRQTLTDATRNVVPRVASDGIPTAIHAWRFAAANGCTTRRFAPTRSPAP